jgi:hypothetical protein
MRCSQPPEKPKGANEPKPPREPWLLGKIGRYDFVVNLA